MSTVLYLAVVAGLLAAVGRSAIPLRERVPLHRWTPVDLVTNAARGARVLAQPTARQRQMREARSSTWPRRSG